MARIHSPAGGTSDGQFGVVHGQVCKILSPAAERALPDYSWKGSVRKLKHVLKRGCVLAEDPLLTPGFLFGHTSKGKAPMPENTQGDYLADPYFETILFEEKRGFLCERT